MRIINEERPHISISQLNTYLQCPLCYYFQYELAIPWRTTPSAVAFGDIIHRAIEVYNTSLMNGHKVTAEDMTAKFTEDWKAVIETNNVDWKSADESADLLMKGRDLLALYYQEFSGFRPKAVELEFRLPILDPSTGLYVESRDAVGRIDLISERGIIVEVKTAGRSASQLDVDTNMQLTLYSWAYRMLYGEPEEKLVVVSLVKTKEPQMQLLKTQRCNKDYSRLFHLIARVIKSIDDKVYYPNPLNIWGCRSCQYVSECAEQWPL